VLGRRGGGSIEGLADDLGWLHGRLGLRLCGPFGPIDLADPVRLRTIAGRPFPGRCRRGSGSCHGACSGAQSVARWHRGAIRVMSGDCNGIRRWAPVPLIPQPIRWLQSRQRTPVPFDLRAIGRSRSRGIEFS
jgi:hypothetical protein